jgi:hypothetical protein
MGCLFRRLVLALWLSAARRTRAYPREPVGDESKITIQKGTKDSPITVERELLIVHSTGCAIAGRATVALFLCSLSLGQPAHCRLCVWFCCVMLAKPEGCCELPGRIQDLPGAEAGGVVCLHHGILQRFAVWAQKEPVGEPGVRFVRERAGADRVVRTGSLYQSGPRRDGEERPALENTCGTCEKRAGSPSFRGKMDTVTVLWHPHHAQSHSGQSHPSPQRTENQRAGE